eukprot:scaffold958_cov32-Tisochrysis_lutea.AAC.1
MILRKLCSNVSPPAASPTRIVSFTSTWSARRDADAIVSYIYSLLIIVIGWICRADRAALGSQVANR